MKRLLIVAVLAGLSLAGTAAQGADFFRQRYSVKYYGGAYLGYPSSTKYSVNYYPTITQGYNGGTQQVDASGQIVYPRYLGQGYTVNGYPGPYTSYSYDYRQGYRQPSANGQYGNGGSGCNSCDAGQAGNGGGMIIENRLRSGGQSSRQPNYGQPIGPNTVQPVPVAPQSRGVEVPKPAEVKPAAPLQPQASGPKSAQRNNGVVPVLVADEHETN